MQTNFSILQLADPAVKEAESILRKCVHCGFCTATCPTYVLLGDELDSPRGRIYQIKDMLENDRPATPKITKHIDRCLSCLSCMTTCPSGVNYMHLVDHARAHIDKTFKRPLPERMLRGILKAVLPNPNLFRLALIGAFFAKPFANLLPGRLTGLVKMAPSRISPPARHDMPQTFPAIGEKKGRVALMSGCAQKVLNTNINGATIRLLTRLGIEVVVAEKSGCCGALVHHMGDENKSHHQAAVNINAWSHEIAGEGLDAIVINASGCGTTVKDYGFMFKNDERMAEKAEAISAITKDITEYLDELGVADQLKAPEDLNITYHSACSLQHGQKVTKAPKNLLEQAGYTVKTPVDAHLCCGSAGTYNLMQPELADKLKERKIATIKATSPDAIAAGNIGCMTQIASDADIPVVHTVELLDWANGGPKPPSLN